MRTVEQDLPVGLFASRVRVEEKLIVAALERRSIPFELLDERSFGPAEQVEGPWSVVLNREISLTRAVHAAWTLESRDVRVVNTAEATQVCGNKWLTTLALRRHDIPTPRAALALSPDSAASVMADVGYPVVVKPVHGSWGRMVTLVRDQETADIVLEYLAALPNPQSKLVYVQELVAKPQRDIRVIVADGRALGAVYRRSEDWRTNVARGAQTLPCPLTPELSGLAARAAHAVGAEVAGVDIVESMDGLTVLEVNHGVEFKGFHAVHGGVLDVAEALVDVLVEYRARALEDAGLGLAVAS